MKSYSYHKRRAMRVIGILYLAMLLFAHTLAAKEKNILVIHSYHQGLEWTDSISSGIFSVFNQHPEFNVYFKYLDTKIYNSEAYIQALVELYKTQIANIHYEAIIASDNAAFNFLSENRDVLFKGTPVFYCGVNFLDKEKLKTLPNFYGYEEVADHRGTLEMMVKFFPDRRKVLIVNDNTLTGQAIQNELDPILSEYENKFTFERFNIFSIAELEEKVRSLDDSYLIYLLVVNKDRENKFISYSKGIKLIKENTEVPIFGTWDFYLGKGIVGGSITRGFEQGRNVAQMSVDYLKRVGDPPSPHQIGENTPCLDYKVIQNFGLENFTINDEITLINTPQISEWQVKLLKITIGVLALLLIVTFVYSHFRKIQNKKLQKLVDQRTLELAQTNENLERINQSKNEILGVVAHDLRNPIGNIHGFCNYIIEEDNEHSMLDEESRLCLNTIGDLSNFMIGLVNNLLDISAIEAGVVKLNLTTQDYVDFLKTEIFQNNALAEKEQVKVKLDSDISKLSLSFDKLKMQQVFINLVSNAIKYSQPGDEIVINVVLENAKIVTKVIDTGPGIPEDKLESIFGKFIKLNNPDSQKNKGVGLGLSIVKAIVEAHKGRIYIESKINVGTTVIYELPLN